MNKTKISKDEFELLRSKFTEVMKTSTVAEQNKLGDIMLKLKVQSLDTEIGRKGNEYKFETFDKDNIVNLRQLVNNALVGSNSSIAFKVDGISYTGNNASVKVEVYPLTEGEPVNADTMLKVQYATDLPRFAFKGFKEEHFLKKFTYSGREYEFLGFIPKARTYKYKARRVGSKEAYKFGNEIIELVTGI